MDISIFTAAGSGRTKLASFDTALRTAGVANYNLLRLSSVIPPHAVILSGDSAVVPGGQWGDKLYCVYASASEDRPGNEAWAGLGWVISPEDGRGLFVEHTGSSREEVDHLIRDTLATMVSERGHDFGDVQTVFAQATCTDEPVTALALAAYQAQGWTA